MALDSAALHEHLRLALVPGIGPSRVAALLARFGTVAVYADDGGQPLQVPVRPLMAPNARLQFVLLYTAPDGWRARALDDLSAAVMDGAVRVGEAAGLPLHHYPLEQTAEAHAAVEGRAVGKVLIDVVP